jgi:hypothetical protein
MACHILLESFPWRLQIWLKPHFNQRSTHKVMALQNCENLDFENFKTFTWESWDKMPFGCWVLAPWPSTKYTIRGKVVASPKSGPWWILWVHVCSWFVRAPKMFKLCTNQLVVWFVQVRVNNWWLSIFLVPIPELKHAPLPAKWCEPRNVLWLFTLPLFSP